MEMEITHLASGSRGNATLLQTDTSKVLVDCGISGRQMERRLEQINVAPEDIDAILLSHHHSDHTKGAEIFQKRWGSDIFANFTTCAHLGLDPINQCRIFDSLDRVQVTPDIAVLPVPVPHDGAENVGFIVSGGGGERAAIVTDLGEPTDELIRHLKGCAHISIEANYDAKRLAMGPYPANLKSRISSRGGHLSNRQTADLLAEVLTDSTKSVVLCHLSEQNNAPHLAESEVLYQVEEWCGDLRIARANGPEFSHWVGQVDAEIILHSK
ncbi:MAG: MBL fold metallo-hydrolase [Candidatus Thermoplasmatota archaeon]|nr:MBL fold metallo-hydrolase [Candidatus Thermoplasmatota archaeon]MEE3082963.1 MBL fold metallo-hydrolase [Candidatus Thermoplasmatota archaeon]